MTTKVHSRPYGLRQIADELGQTASGAAYHGNALYVAVDVPGLSPDDRQVLFRWLDRRPSAEDRQALHAIARKLEVLE